MRAFMATQKDRLPKAAAAAVRLATLALLLLSAAGCRMVAQGRNVDGVRYFQQGQYPVALQRFDAALTIDPQNPDTYYNKAAVYHRMGLANRDQNVLTQAESLYNQCLNLSPNHVDCHRGLAVLLSETGRNDKAFTLLRNWTIQSPQNADARVELARLYEESADPRSAELALNEALALDLRNWRAHAALGRLKEQSGDFPQALQNYNIAYSLNRFQPDLQQHIAALQTRVSPAQAGVTPPLNPAANRSAGGLAPFRRY
ncbi:MAG TPA: tetratricopeptide repeat protein [Pirellulaceae bacterium]|nr:tetratricopeptide repeat protein [Pirellulaceae bacterium]